jgi:hypothetical protein
MTYRPERGWGFSKEGSGSQSYPDELTALRQRIETLEARAQSDRQPVSSALDQRRLAPEYPTVVAIRKDRPGLETEITETPIKAGDP